MSPRRQAWRRVRSACLAALAAGFAVMWIVGYFRYTSVGVDNERLDEDWVVLTYARVRWPGDGSFWIGFAAEQRPPDGSKLDAFDLGGTLFGRPERPRPRSFWNRLDFWLVNHPGEDPFTASRYPGAVWSRWVAVPAWLPVLAFGIWPLRSWLHRRSGREGNSRDRLPR